MSINGRVFNVQDLLREAVELRILSLTKKCLNDGADPNFLYRDGFGVIHILSVDGDVRFFRKFQELCGYSLDVHLKLSPFDLTPLICATKYSNYDFMDELLRFGADPNYVDKRGKSTLHYAAQNLNLKTIKLLLEHEASYMKPDVYKNTPLSYTVIHHANLPISQILLDISDLEELNELFLESVLNCHNENRQKLTMYLVKHGADFDYIQPVTLRNCLHVVAITNYLPLAEDLVLLGANVYHEDITKKLPVHLAEDLGNREVYNFLKEITEGVSRKALRLSTWRVRGSILSLRHRSSNMVITSSHGSVKISKNIEPAKDVKKRKDFK